MKTKEEVSKLIQDNLSSTLPNDVKVVREDWLDRTYKDYVNYYVAKDIDYDETEWLKEVYAEYACELCQHEHHHFEVIDNKLVFICDDCGAFSSFDEETTNYAFNGMHEWEMLNVE